MIIFDKENFPPTSHEHVSLSDSSLRTLGNGEGSIEAIEKLGSDLGKILFANTAKFGLTMDIVYGLTHAAGKEGTTDDNIFGNAAVFNGSEGADTAFIQAAAKGALEEMDAMGIRNPSAYEPS